MEATETMVRHEQYIQEVDEFLAEFRVHLLADLEERPNATNSITEVMGTLSVEAFDVQIAHHERFHGKFSFELDDLLKKLARSRIDMRVKNLRLV